MCTAIDIKELLPAFVEQGLGHADTLRVEGHLGFCEDCRTELSLLRMMAEERVPDPGKVFWATMPDRVYRAVQEQKSRRKPFDLARLADRLTLPRWAWAAATVGIVFMISWFIIQSPRHYPDVSGPPGYDLPDENMIADNTGTLHLSEFDQDELNIVDDWAGRELASIAHEAEFLMANNHDTDMYEELAELNAQEVKRLSEIIIHYKQEG